MPSSLIRDSRYDPRSRTLSVWFVTNGKQYDYRGVPPEIYFAFRKAFSKGHFFNREIRGNYEFRQVDDENEDAPRNHERKS